jgi:thioredoxin 1
MHKITSEREFERVWKESEALICDFSASWCGPCKMLEPVLRRLEKDCPDIVFVNVDVDEMFDLSERHRIEAMPTVLFVRKGRETKRIIGFDGYETLSKEAKRLLRPDCKK